MKLFPILFTLLLLLATTASEEAPLLEDCDAEILKLNSCFEYISAPPNQFSSSPSSECCDYFASAFYDRTNCVCYLVNEPLVLGFPLNATRINSLSSICLGLASDGDSAQSVCDMLGLKPPPSEAGTGSVNSPSPSPSLPPSSVPSPVEEPTSSPSPSPVQVPTSSPSPSLPPSSVPSPVEEPSSSPSPSPVQVPTSSPSPGPSPVEAQTPGPSPVEAPTSSPTPGPSPVEAPTGSPTCSPPSPVEVPTASPSGYNTHNSPAASPDDEPETPWVTTPVVTTPPDVFVTTPNVSHGCQFLPIIGLYIVSMFMLHL